MSERDSQGKQVNSKTDDKSQPSTQENRKHISAAVCTCGVHVGDKSPWR